MRLSVLILSTIATLVLALGVNQLSYRYFLSEEMVKAEGRLSVYHGTVLAELERFSHLPYVLALDPFVVATALGGDTALLNSRLDGFAAQAGLDAIYLMNPDGDTISASNAHQQGSFLGQNYGFRPYFQDALNGDQGRFYGIGATTGLPGYFIANPVQDLDGRVLGVIAIKIDLSKLQRNWQGSGEAIALANASGVILLSSEPAWRYRTLAPLSSSQKAQIALSRQFPGQALNALPFDRTDTRTAQVDGEERLHLVGGELPHDWTLHYFTSEDRAAVLSWGMTAVVGLAIGVAMILYQVERARQMGAALRRSEEEELQLREANERLAIEIEDRRTAERRLKRTQSELESASRLAALGQLSASVTHELGQPIAAMRNHLAAAEIGGRSLELPSKIAALVDRMEGITKQLRFFATRGGEPFGDVDLVSAMQASLTLMKPNIETTKVEVDFTPPQTAINVRGDRLRLEQVMTNLLRNAVDAVEQAEHQRIHIEIGENAQEQWFTIADSGHGLGAATLAELQEPFVTTRESGRGMGLGLAISAGIVKDHSALMSAINLPEGGAEFRVTFPRGEAEAAVPDLSEREQV